MKHFYVKVCGITREDDGLLAELLGADLVGFIFYSGSPRHIGYGEARKIRNALSPLTHTVGVFVNEKPNAILSARDKAHFNIVQLHGEVSGAMVRKLKHEGLGVIQAFAIGTQGDIRAAMTSAADFILLDTLHEKQFGGTGKQFDWKLRPNRSTRNIAIAGGLNSTNVSEAIRLFKPAIVDVNSGVETSPGIKSHRKLRQFMAICDRLRYGT